jgi:hypothetical protein
MKKIPSVFIRDFAGNPRLVTQTVNPECQWVLDGEGIATRKYDGTCCLVDGGVLFKRYDAKHGKKPPQGFIPAQPEPDEKTGHWPGWLCVSPKPEDKWFMAAWMEIGGNLPDGTYELCGPHFQTNAEKFTSDRFVKHGEDILPMSGKTQTYYTLRTFVVGTKAEGIVWHHPTDGRMAKLKRSDFGEEWPLHITHGSTCQKVAHSIADRNYFHDERDDRPFGIDGKQFCGRCHRSL